MLGDFPLSRLLLSKDANYPWFITVPRRADISELFQLNEADQQQLWKETTYLAETLRTASLPTSSTSRLWAMW